MTTGEAVTPPCTGKSHASSSEAALAGEMSCTAGGAKNDSGIVTSPIVVHWSAVHEPSSLQDLAPEHASSRLPPLLPVCSHHTKLGAAPVLR